MFVEILNQKLPLPRFCSHLLESILPILWSLIRLKGITLYDVGACYVFDINNNFYKSLTPTCRIWLCLVRYQFFKWRKTIPVSINFTCEMNSDRLIMEIWLLDSLQVPILSYSLCYYFPS